MDSKTKDLLETAINNHIDGMTLEDLRDLAAQDLWSYYSKNASDDEVLEFIELTATAEE